MGNPELLVTVVAQALLAGPDHPFSEVNHPFSGGNHPFSGGNHPFSRVAVPFLRVGRWLMHCKQSTRCTLDSVGLQGEGIPLQPQLVQAGAQLFYPGLALPSQVLLFLSLPALKPKPSHLRAVMGAAGLTLCKCI